MTPPTSSESFKVPFTAIVLVFVLGYDNRCLKPDDSKDPELWDHYDPDDFYYATSQDFNIFNCLMLNTFNLILIFHS